MSALSQSSEELQFAIDCIFKKYDSSEEGILEADDLIKIIKDAFNCLKIEKKVSL